MASCMKWGSRESVRNPWAIGALKGDSRRARSTSTWIHWWSSVASANCWMRSWVTVNQSVTAISWPRKSLSESGESRMRLAMRFFSIYGLFSEIPSAARDHYDLDRLSGSSIHKSPFVILVSIVTIGIPRCARDFRKSSLKLFLGRQLRPNSLRARPVFLAQLFFQDLAGARSWQRRVKKLHRARTFVVGKAAAAEVEDFL